MKDENNVKITKAVIDKTPDGRSLREKSLTVEGNNMTQVKKVFDDEWKRE